MAEALYRKYRPQIFEDVVGQEHIERTIKNAIEQDKVSHAYLFSGPRGTGKTTTARLLAKALLCEHGPTPEPDGTCSDCLMIADGGHPDVYELDAASRTGVENVREEIIGRVQFAPTRGKYKVYIIDEVHMLSTAAFNALLKTIEEPPSHVVFILATTDPQKVPETIHSRCQSFEFRRISQESLVSRLGAICVSEDVEFEGEALDLIAHRAEGGMRNALTSLEQLIAFGEGRVTLEVAERMLGGVDTNDLAEIMRAIGMRDVANCFRWTAEFVETGSDLAQFTRDLAEHVRNLYVMALTDESVALEVGDTERRQLVAELPLFGTDRLSRLLSVLGDLAAELRTSTNQRLSFEIALTRMVRPDSDLTLESLAERVEALEAGHSSTAHVSAPARTTPAVAQPAPAPQEHVQPALAPQEPAQPAPAPQEHAQPAQPSTPQAAPIQSAAAQPQVAQPEVQPATTQPAASSQLASSLQNPAALQRVWQAALAALKKHKAAYGVLFLNTKALYDDAKHTLTIEFPAENAFAFKAVQKPDVQTAVSLAIEQACGQAVPFCYVQGGNTAATSVAALAQSVVAAAREASPVPAQPSAAAATPVQQVVPAPAPQEASNPRPINTAPQNATPSASYDIPPYDDEQVPYDEFDALPAPDPVESFAAAPAREPSQAQPAREPAQPAATLAQAQPARELAQPAPSSESQTRIQSPDELQDLLSAAFNQPIIVEEVRD